MHPGRRKLLVLAAGLSALAPVALSQRSYRVGILDPGAATSEDRVELWRAMLNRLRELGFEEGRTLAVEMRWGERNEFLLPGLARDLVGIAPDVVIASTTPAVKAAMAATATIPIVFPTAGNPVGNGLVKSLARPGGNVTGQSIFQADSAAKRIELLLELVPHAKRLAYIGPAGNVSVAAAFRGLQKAARARGVDLRQVDAFYADDIAREFARFSAEPVDALIAAAIMAGRRQQLAQLAERHRLPTIYAYMEHLDVGGLIAFGPDLHLAYRRAGDYVHRILQGAKPADMPVEQVHFSLGVNLRAARAIGIAVPQSILLRADRVLE